MKLAALFGPEHGVRGSFDSKVADSVDEQTGLPVYSLYGETRQPRPEHLKDLGAHQWAHAVSTDLVHWKHLPYAVSLTEESEASICTGSMFKHADTYYAFYATRRGDFSERVDVAVSRDGVHFQKKPLPLAPAAGYKNAFRDPNVVVDAKTGLFNMWITAEQPGVGGTLVRLTSKDLESWSPAESLVTGGPAPECPDHFAWKGRHYLIYSRDLRALYRIGDQQFGPWRTPDERTRGRPWCSAATTAAPASPGSTCARSGDHPIAGAACRRDTCGSVRRNSQAGLFLSSNCSAANEAGAGRTKCSA